MCCFFVLIIFNIENHYLYMVLLPYTDNKAVIKTVSIHVLMILNYNFLFFLNLPFDETTMGVLYHFHLV